ncbi:MAG: hypothetical protein ACD_66C00067G0001 [uncultured bacterium]|nr:MAG: hypothetical protein ACD_66C00067G0001 [uncultured bacterium]
MIKLVKTANKPIKEPTIIAQLPTTLPSPRIASSVVPVPVTPTTIAEKSK